MAAPYLLSLRKHSSSSLPRLLLLSRPLHHHHHLLPPLPPTPTPTPTPVPQTSRPFSSSSGADFNLLRVLRDEIDHEQQNEDASPEHARPPPQPFSIIDKPGKQEVILHRSYGEEDIRVGCMFHSEIYPSAEGEGEGEDEETTSQMVQMTVKVSKGGDNPFVEIGCVTYGEDPVIDRVLYKDSAIDSRDLPYEGPDFSDLDDNVKTGFLKFLIARGIDGSFGNYILKYMYHKEQREYSRWLQSLEKFIQK